MKYDDLVEFQPIESVIQLRDARKDASARRHVESYVISQEMAQRLSEVVIPQLEYDAPYDNKGLLIVGNYGTGKSHLLSVISSIAENEDVLHLLTNDRVKAAAKNIAGKFKVIRLEIGATEMGLREIITTALENTLEDWGISFRFPEATQIYENKPSFEKMMSLFHERFGQQGLLMVVDELLDYLRSRSDHPLIKDLGFLREIGEVCKDLKFRFVAGVQEAIFDSGRFAHVADSLGRVKDRFQQVRIASTDVKFVVANRLLKKSPAQLAQIREYLQPFSKFYGHMNERMDDFATLFPIHPDYIDTFERIPIVEKRGVLQIISDTIKELMGREVPPDYPGIKAHDSYWKALIENPANKAVPEVSAIMECSGVLEAKIRNAFARPQYQPMAIRIIDALSVHRLTTHDLYAPIGLTPEELRDGLCLFHKAVGGLGGDPADDLLTLVETVLREIHKTVSGQFISSNKDNRQVFLDLKKIDDYDALIEKRAESLDEGTLDRYYYDALKQVLECTDIPTHVTGYQIWQHELEWKERRAPRLGYLFFGAPNERSTAVPKRDFYLYFIQPFAPPRYKDNKMTDEVFFRLQEKDGDFEGHLKHYAAALELASTSSGLKKDAYRKKASEHLGDLTKWLQEHLLTSMDVTYQGQKKKLLGWLKGGAGRQGSLNMRDTVNAVGSACLAEHFANVAPNYPHFSILLTTASIPQAAQDAIRGIAQPATRTRQAKAVLDALELLDGDSLEPAKSQYAREIVDLLKSKGTGQVLNRQELIQPIDDVSYFLPHKFRLEPEWAVVLFTALVYSGDAVLAVPGTKFDAAGLDALATTDISDLTRFKHLEQPKGWPMAAIKALFELMDLAPGMAVDVTQGNATPVSQLQKAILERVEALVITRHRIMEGIPFWGQNLFSEEEVDTLAEALQATKIFIEGLQAYNTPGKLKNLKYEAPEILSHKATFEKLKEIGGLEKFAFEMGQITQYLSFAEGYLPEDHGWRQNSTAMREQLLKDMRQPQNRTSAKFKGSVSEKLKSLKSDYIKEYFSLHKKARLTLNQDKAKIDLTRDYRLAQLQKLTAIDLLNRQQLVDFQERLGKLKTCFALTEKELDNDPKCPHCGFWPGMEDARISADATLETLKTDLVKIHASWTQALLNDLEDPVVQNNLTLLKPAQRKLLDAFIAARELPDEIDSDFVQAVKEALMGLSKVPVASQSLKKALIPDGSPATPAEFKERFDRFMEDILKGKDAAKVRLVLE
jgi:predicted ATPase